MSDAGQRYYICVRNEGYLASLQLCTVYLGISDPEAESHGMLRIVDESGRAVDGDGTAGGDQVDSFFRLFGDSDGDGEVDRTDLAALLSTLGKRSGEAGYLPIFDFNANGRIDVRELGQVARRV